MRAQRARPGRAHLHAPINTPNAGAYYGVGPGDDAAEVRLRDRHQSFRTGANARLQRGTSGLPRSPSGLSGPSHQPGDEAAAAAAANAAAAARKYRRRWDDTTGGTNSARDENMRDGDTAVGAGPGRPVNTGHTVRMKRGEAWGKFLAYEGSCQVGESAVLAGAARGRGGAVGSCEGAGAS
jgi:hypothetical protein